MIFKTAQMCIHRYIYLYLPFSLFSEMSEWFQVSLDADYQLCLKTCNYNRCFEIKKYFNIRVSVTTLKPSMFLIYKSCEETCINLQLWWRVLNCNIFGDFCFIETILLHIWLFNNFLIATMVYTIYFNPYLRH